MEETKCDYAFIFVNDLDDDGIESTFINFTESTRLREDSSSVKNKFRISNGLEKLEKQRKRNNAV